MISNDNLELEPTTSFEGNNLEFNFPNLKIGVAEYDKGPTGCTVFYFPKGAATAIDTRGGSVGSIGNFDWNHAICLAGGSLYGLEAATGVSAELFAKANYGITFDEIAVVSGAIIYDYPPRKNSIYPDKDLGRAAIKAAQSAKSCSFPIGKRGAGCSATVGKFDFEGESAGQGGAFRQVGETKIAAFSIVNAIGAIVNRQNQVVRGNLNPKTGERRHVIEDIDTWLANSDWASETQNKTTGNTTLTVVVTNQKLNSVSLQQLAKQIHTSMGRAIQPFHTKFDGDVLYMVSTNEIDNPKLPDVGLGIIASEVVWDAVLSIVDNE